jgi:hypothetical protein
MSDEDNSGIALIILLMVIIGGGAILKATLNPLAILAILVAIGIFFGVMLVFGEEEDFTYAHQYEW